MGKGGGSQLDIRLEGTIDVMLLNKIDDFFLFTDNYLPNITELRVQFTPNPPVVCPFYDIGKYVEVNGGRLKL